MKTNNNWHFCSKYKMKCNIFLNEYKQDENVINGWLDKVFLCTHIQSAVMQGN